MSMNLQAAVRFEPKPLPYAYDALSPVISEETLRYHHDKHYAGYVNKLNELIAGTPFEGESLEDIIMTSDRAIFNNAAQVWNHEFYFEQLSPEPALRPSESLLEAINRQFGSVEAVREAMNQAAVNLFGSGWVWLVVDDEGELSILSTRNAGLPMRHGLTPLLALDVWEHAYYIDYRNRRGDAMHETWRVIDWRKADERYENR
ncbi:MAG: superoxide dismutase [Alistipes sp.]|nr:superoxide dismutase [Alistipes sp.]MBQ8581416.1 superoxide dismutase [Alistipes sp.]